MPKDGWDLGILIRLNWWKAGLPFNRVMGELISEVGWLKGGDTELEERLNSLIDEGLIVKKDNTLYPDSPKYAYYTITEKGSNYINSD